MLTNGQRTKKRMNVARQNIAKAAKIMQKGHSEWKDMEVDLSELCVALIRPSQKKKNKNIRKGRG